MEEEVCCVGPVRRGRGTYRLAEFIANKLVKEFFRLPPSSRHAEVEEKKAG